MAGHSRGTVRGGPPACHGYRASVPPRSLLVVAQHAPPSPLVGARRPAALAKQLTRLGHRVTVLTSLASGSGPVPGAALTVRSRDLLATRLNWRRGSLEAMQGRREGSYREASPLQSIVVPDLSLVTWTPFALPRALSLSRRLRFDCVITTGPPHSAHLVGLALRHRGSAWIADMRDGWTFDPPRAPWPSRALSTADALMERLVLTRADRVVAVTEPIARDVRERHGLDAAVVTNGFDPEEVAAPDGAGLLRQGRFALVHTGRLIAAGETPRTLLEGVIELARRRPGADRPLEVVFAGAMSEPQERLVTDRRYAEVARTVGVLERPRALALQAAADALVVMAEGMPGRPSTSVATGKLFEYLAVRRPVLVLGDQTEAARIVARAGAGLSAPATDPGAVADALERLVDDGSTPDAAAVNGYSWPVLAERYERLVEEALDTRGVSGGPRRS
jgi:glycosyltransferase involved in cell wall biosynthesis